MASKVRAEMTSKLERINKLEKEVELLQLKLKESYTKEQVEDEVKVRVITLSRQNESLRS